jgi:hypothetical protein
MQRKSNSALTQSASLAIRKLFSSQRSPPAMRQDKTHVPSAQLSRRHSCGARRESSRRISLTVTMCAHRVRASQMLRLRWFARNHNPVMRQDSEPN